jgi:hypothetical protein
MAKSMLKVSDGFGGGGGGGGGGWLHWLVDVELCG